MPFSLALHGQMPCAAHRPREPTLKFPLASLHSALHASVFSSQPNYRRDRRRALPLTGTSPDRRGLTLFVSLPLLRRALSHARTEGTRGASSPQPSRSSARSPSASPGFPTPPRWPFVAVYAVPPRVRRSRIPALGRVELSRETPHFGDGAFPGGPDTRRYRPGSRPPRCGTRPSSEVSGIFPPPTRSERLLSRLLLACARASSNAAFMVLVAPREPADREALGLIVGETAGCSRWR